MKTRSKAQYVTVFYIYVVGEQLVELELLSTSLSILYYFYSGFMLPVERDVGSCDGSEAVRPIVFVIIGKIKQAKQSCGLCQVGD